VDGYCFGGLMAYIAAARTDVLAALCYYGGGIDTFIGEAKAVKCPIQLHFGAKDVAIPPQVWDKVRGAFAGREDAEVFVYDGAAHGFNCPRRGSFHPEASKLARSRTLDLLRRTVGPRA
jgi:carboxymethylenebutenolidase